ncbi:hypothetical protein HK097_001735, partial [Rhizophlyctis rosea]
MQTSTTHKSSLTHTASTIVRSEGVLGLYAGLSASLLRQATYSTTRFAVVDETKAWFAARSEDGKLTPLHSLLASTLGGIAGGIVGTPADLCNIRMQNDGKLPPDQRRNYKNAFDGLFRIWKSEGLKSLFIGVGPNVGRGVLMTGSQVTSYDIIKQKLLTTPYFRDDVYTHFTASLAAGLVATTLCSPFDVLKTRIMSHTDGHGAYKSTLDAAWKIWRSEGFAAFLK